MINKKEEFLPRTSQTTRTLALISIRKFVWFVWFVVNLNLIYAQDNIQIEIQPRFVQQFSWTPSDYALRYEVEIEKEEDGVYTRFLWERTEESVVHIALPYGNYRFRVIPYDLVNRPGVISEYQYIEVKPAELPQVYHQFDESSEESKPVSRTGGFFGIFPEINAYTRSGFAVGGGLVFGININRNFSAGFKGSFFNNLDTVNTLELLLFLRYYFPFAISHKPFIQAEAGAMMFMESGYYDNWEAVPFIAGGAALGWRFNLGKRWFIDPSFRFGYPYMWGGNLSLGVKL